MVFILSQKDIYLAVPLHPNEPTSFIFPTVLCFAPEYYVL